MASARLSGWRRAQRGEREKSAKGRGGGEESERGFLVFGVFGGRASERVVCVPFCVDAAVLVLWGCAGGGALGACKVCVCEKAAISFCVQK